MVVQTVLIVTLILYGIDLMNARDAFSVVSWFSAIILTVISALSTLLQVDDADAVNGGIMILYLIRLTVEGCFFCLMVSSSLAVVGTHTASNSYCHLFLSSVHLPDSPSPQTFNYI